MATELEIIEPTTFELICSKQSRMLEISSELNKSDYKHIRHIRESILGKTTLSELEYKEFCSRQKEITDEYNMLELEVKVLYEKLHKEQLENKNTL